MMQDDCENLNRYVCSTLKATGVEYKPSDEWFTMTLHKAEELSIIKQMAKARIDEIKQRLGNERVGVSNWFSLADVGGRYLLSMTYRVM